ncbi:MAG TPA: TonB-dependent receptor [Steroidobacteraceae bacterium]|nr:TonB-dependent receptor [Steroidobacteraceae bacterium]
MHTFFRTSVRLWLCNFILISLQGPVAWSQSVEPPQTESVSALEEITVTAQKRSENLQVVPIAISAFTSDELGTYSIRDLSDVAKLTPNVTLDAGSFAGGSRSVLSAFIRGIGQSDFAFNFDPGVGVYLDGVYLGRTVGANVGLLDVERVEVSKGPQGTLFGRNTIGGAINVVTREPSDKFNFTGEVTGGSFQRLDVNAFADMPISDTVRSSLAFSSQSREGYLKRIPFSMAGFVVDPKFTANTYDYPDREGGIGQWAARGKLHWLPSDSFDAELTADYSRVRASNAPQTLIEPVEAGLLALNHLCINTPAPVLGAIGLGFVCGPRSVIGTSLAGANVDADPNNDRALFDSRFLTGDIDKSYATDNSFEHSENYGVGLTLNWDLSGGTSLKSITAYRELDWEAGSDLDGSPLEILAVDNVLKQHQFSEELQLVGNLVSDRLKYVVGAFYYDEYAKTNDYVPIGGNLLQIYSPDDLNTTAWALFTNINFKLTDLIGLTVGGRYTEERKDILVEQQDLNALAYKAAGCFPVTDACRIALGFPDPGNALSYAPPTRPKRTFTNFSPRVGVEFHVAEATMLYASYSEGYKTGSWTTRLSNPVTELSSFRPEEATTYEVGIKSGSNRVRVNAAAFFTDYSDIQLNFQEGVSPVIKNAGDAEIYGAEVELTALLTDGFTLRSAAGYQHAEYTHLDPGALGITLDSKLPKTPEWMFSLAPEYELRFSNGTGMRFVVNYTHTDSVFNDTENTTLIDRPDVDDLGASVSFLAAEHWEFTVGGTNLLDERYLTAGQAQVAGGLYYGTYSRPREWYASFRFTF